MCDACVLRLALSLPDVTQRDACDRFFFIVSGTVQVIVQENPHAPLTSRSYLSSNNGYADDTNAATSCSANATGNETASEATAANATSNAIGSGSGSAVPGAAYLGCNAGIASEVPSGNSNNDRGASAGDGGDGSGAKQIAVLHAGDCFGAISLEMEMRSAGHAPCGGGVSSTSGNNNSSSSGTGSNKGMCASLLAKSKCEILTLSAPYYKAMLHKEIRCAEQKVDAAVLSLK